MLLILKPVNVIVPVLLPKHTLVVFTEELVCVGLKIGLLLGVLPFLLVYVIQMLEPFPIVVHVI